MSCSAPQLKEHEAASHPQQRRRDGNGDEQRWDTETTARSTLTGSLVNTDPMGIGMRHDVLPDQHCRAMRNGEKPAFRRRREP